MDTIAIRAGHHGKEKWNIGISGKYIEADGNLQFAYFLKEELKDYFNVILTRKGDEVQSLSEGALIAAKNKALVYFSVHSDAIADNTKRGCKIFYSVDTPQDKAIAEEIGQLYSEYSGIKFLGAYVRESEKYPGEDYYTEIDVAQDNGIPHEFLIERGFHTNTEDEALLLNEIAMRNGAKGIGIAFKKNFIKGYKEKIMEVKVNPNQEEFDTNIKLMKDNNIIDLDSLHKPDEPVTWFALSKVAAKLIEHS